MLRMGRQHQLQIDTTSNADQFNDDNLMRYRAVVFLNTTGDVLNPEQQNDFERFIQAGGGYVGIHAAADTEYEWPWYGKLAGAWFNGHPNEPNVPDAEFVTVYKTTNPPHPYPPPCNPTPTFYITN